MSTVSIAVGGLSIAVYQPDAIGVDDKLNARSTAAFTVLGHVAAQLQQQMSVVITDSARGQIYAGTIDAITLSRIMPNNTFLWKVTCKDGHYSADKRLYTGEELTGYLAGDAVAVLHQQVLAQEGVTAQVAMRRDHDSASWGQGTLSGVVAAADGSLQLAPSGTPFVILEDTQSQWAAAQMLTNVSAVTNPAGTGALSLTSASALKMAGSAQGGKNSDLVCAFTFWKGSIACASGDYLEYDVWIDPNNPAKNGGVDIIASDGSMHREQNVSDQNGINSDTDTDLSSYAVGQWYHRHIQLSSSFNSKTIAQAVMVLDGNVGGNYILYARHIKYYSAAHILKATFYESGATQSNTLQKNVGYFNLSVSPITAYESSGSRLSNPYVNNTCPILLDSFVTWAELDPALPSGSSGGQIPPVLVELSYDNGATWVTLTNNAPIPTLQAGANLTATTWLTRITLTAAGDLPSASPTLDYLVITLRPAANATVARYTDIDTAGDGTLAQGTLNGVIFTSSGLILPNIINTWNNGDLSGQTLYGASSPAQSGWFGGVSLTSNDANDVRAKLTKLGSVKDFVLELDIQLVAAVANTNAGIVYRTTYWGNSNDTFAYFAGITPSNVWLAKGTNNSSGNPTGIASPSASFTAGKWYHLMVVANGNNHQVWVDGTKYIDLTDSSFPNAGNIGLRYYNHTGSRSSAYYDNLGIVPNASSAPFVGTRIHPGLALSGIVGHSRVLWNAQVPPNCLLTVDASLDGGSTYLPCTNGGPIPGADTGANVAGKTLLLRETLTSANANTTPILTGMHAAVYGSYSASGNRISPVLALGAIGRCGSTSFTWAGNAPPGTSIVGATSPDGSTWTNVSSGSPIAGIANQPAQAAEDFAVNTSGQYISTFQAGGAVPVATWDITNSRLLLTGGTNGLYIWTGGPAAMKEGSYTAIVSQSDTGGLVRRYVDQNNHYRLLVNDSQAGASPQTLTLWRRLTSVSTQVLQVSVNFTRGHYHTLVWSIVGQTHTLTWDGVVVGTYTDGTPVVGPGQTGFYSNTPTGSIWYSLAVQALGDDLTGKNAYDRLTLTSTDPTVSPSVSAATLSARGPQIMDGVILPQTSYNQKYVSSDIDDAAKQSNYWWDINGQKQLLFQNRAAQLAPWPLWSGIHADGTCDMEWAPEPQVTFQSPQYRNRQYITGAYDLVSTPESKQGDGVATSWVLKGIISSIQSITVNTQPRTWGIQGVDPPGKDFYYTPGQVNLAQAQGAVVLGPSELLNITYTAQIPYTAMKESLTQQAILAALDQTSGIVEATEDCGGTLNKAAADALAQARITQWAILSRDWAFPTRRANPALGVGQLLSTFVPELGFADTDFLITEVATTIRLQADGSHLSTFLVTCTEGYPLGSWSRTLVLN